MSTAARFRYSFDCLGTSGELRINDLPVAENEGGNRTRNGLINEYIVDGRNRVMVRIGDLSAAPAPAPPNAWVTLNISSGEPLCEIDWRPGPDARYPTRQEREFVSGTSEGPRLFQLGAILSKTPRELAGAQQLVGAMVDALRGRRLQTVLELLRRKAGHQSAAFGFPLTRVTSQSTRLFSEWFGNPAWDLQPVDFKKLRFGLFGDNRVLRVRRENGAPVIESVPVDGAIFSMDLLLSLIDGTWVIVL